MELFEKCAHRKEHGDFADNSREPSKAWIVFFYECYSKSLSTESSQTATKENDATHTGLLIGTCHLGEFRPKTIRPFAQNALLTPR